ncbi:uncharacterized protein EI90DRAFT_654952 [Cantharellus anzutake]|uniref:uncharacterized protein n=1 Tax=Cantharellus anzutake TaxID=1750568 RepID=UPI001903DC60|nr:uncharacterized protein EI90DRAFT_654952 [Cantharellus anzutake]KAF8312581.1 hypothetical protein EI90DRAFT_654952 [Cantharellus anzutake]
MSINSIRASVPSCWGSYRINFICGLVKTYSFWKKNGLLPKEGLADNAVTLLDHVDAWLADTHGIGFRLRRWAVKIMSFVISANRLFTLTQSRRLRKFLDGTFVIKLLPCPATTPYRCNLSSENIRVALDAALHQTKYSTAEWDEERESFTVLLRDKLEDSEACRKPTVHAELVMITALFKGELQEVLPYIGVSKLSCMMCIHYIQALNEVTGKRIAVKGSHRKAYPGWSWPSLPSHDREVRRALLHLNRQQLWSDFNLHVESRRGSNSSMGYGVPGFETVATEDDIRAIFSLELGRPVDALRLYV